MVAVGASHSQWHSSPLGHFSSFTAFYYVVLSGKFTVYPSAVTKCEFAGHGHYYASRLLVPKPSKDSLQTHEPLPSIISSGSNVEFGGQIQVLYPSRSVVSVGY